MKRLLIILIFFTGCKSKNETDLLGIWIGEFGIGILLNNETETKIIDSVITENEFFEQPADTNYFLIPRIVEFTPNELIISIVDKIYLGKWSLENGQIFIDMDSIDALGKFVDSKLKIEFTTDEHKWILSFQKQNGTNHKKIEKRDIIGSYWKNELNDSIYSTYYFMDTLNVVVSSKQGTDLGYWKTFNYSGITCMNIWNTELGELTVIYMEDFEIGKSVTFQDYKFKQPKAFNTLTKIDSLLTLDQYELLMSKLVGSWTNKVDFYPQEFVKEEGLCDLKYELTFGDTIFKVNYSGSSINSKENFENQLQGTWILSKTGDYITLKYKVSLYDEAFEIEEFMTVISVNEDDMVMSFDLKSLTLNGLGFGERRFKIIRNNVSLSKN